MAGSIIMEVNLEALETVGDIQSVLEMMDLNPENPMVSAIRNSVTDLQRRKSLLAYLKMVDAPVIYLNLSLGGELN